MICSNCGQEMEDGIVFCTNCGQKIVSAASDFVSDSASEAEEVVAEAASDAAADVADNVSDAVEEGASDFMNAAAFDMGSEAGSFGTDSMSSFGAAPVAAPDAGNAADGGAPAKKNGKGGKKTGLVIGIVAVAAALVLFVLVIIILIIVLLVSPKKIDLNKYTTVNFSGYETVGEADVQFDIAAFEKDYNGKIKWKKSEDAKQTKERYGALGYDDEAAFRDALGLKIEKSGELSNGEKVTITWDEDMVSKCFKNKVKFSEKKGTYTVEGLAQPYDCNYFDMVGVTVSGYDTVGTFRVYDNNIAIDLRDIDLEYDEDKNGTLSNGDKLVVKLTTDDSGADVIRTALKEGYRLSEVEHEFVISGLKELDVFNPFDSMTFDLQGYNHAAKLDVRYNGQYYVGWKADRDDLTNLSNGDEIKFTIYVDGYDNVNDYLINRGAQASQVEYTYKVEGLEDLTSFDPFDGVTVTFEGTSPFGKVTVDTTNAAYRKLDGADKLNPYYIISEKKDLSNGDEITITFAYNSSNSRDMKEECSKIGLMPTQLEKKYTVEGLNEPVVYVADLTEEAKTLMDSKARDDMEAYVAKYASNRGAVLNSMDYIGAVASRRITPDDWYTNEKFYMIYKISLTDEYGTIEYYEWYEFEDVEKDKDGQIVVDLEDMDAYSDYSNDVQTHGSTSYQNHSYEGVVTLDDAFTNIVSAQKDKWYYDSDIDGWGSNMQ